MGEMRKRERGAGVWQFVGSRGDVWGKQDHCALLGWSYEGSGNGCMIKVDRMGSVGGGPPDPWAKVGVMVRADAGPDAAMTACAVTGGHGVMQIARQRRGDVAECAPGTTAIQYAKMSGRTDRRHVWPPSILSRSVWLRLMEKDAMWMSLVSLDGKRWARCGAGRELAGGGHLMGVFASAHTGELLSCVVPIVTVIDRRVEEVMTIGEDAPVDVWLSAQDAERRGEDRPV